MPQSYPSMGEAVAAAMQHNIRLAYGDPLPGSDSSPRVRPLPRPSADPHSVSGMIARLTETAAPSEVAALIEEVNGALPQLTELVAATADWTRVRLEFDDPHSNATFETWTRLAAARGMLRDVQEALESAVVGIAVCPAEPTDPRHHDMVNALRTDEQLGDALGTDTVAVPAERNPGTNRQRAARTGSPQAVAHRTTPSPSPPQASADPSPPRAPRT
ncbi:hypothetical protein [Streptomyces sp. NBC_00986]|uniref:hypothetical protein n=1 Tax=Streptomyces sp. NBC_00986 TaxID=2903702 RepID=UPI003862E5D4|nr:hypothetical protein OG504_03590 [Streptomyces sp. NBC_00986]